MASTVTVFWAVNFRLTINGVDGLGFHTADMVVIDAETGECLFPSRQSYGWRVGLEALRAIANDLARDQNGMTMAIDKEAENVFKTTEDPKLKFKIYSSFDQEEIAKKLSQAMDELLHPTG